jgi:DNA mismatch repair protein MutS2
MAGLARRARAVMKKSLDAMDDAVQDSLNLETEDEDYMLPRPLAVGDRVRACDLKVEATVLELPNDKGLVLVQAGAMKMRMPVTSLRLLGGQKPEPLHEGKRRVKGEEPVQPNTAAETRLDLRGQTVEDCLLELDRYMDQALRTGLHEFTIVHGKGTGALRAAVQQYLRKSPYVKMHRLGVYGEGETGVTVVELK